MKLAWGFDNDKICVGATLSVSSSGMERAEDIALSSVKPIAYGYGAESCVYNKSTDTVEVHFHFRNFTGFRNFSKLIQGISS